MSTNLNMSPDELAKLIRGIEEINKKKEAGDYRPASPINPQNIAEGLATTIGLPVRWFMEDTSFGRGMQTGIGNLYQGIGNTIDYLDNFALIRLLTGDMSQDAEWWRNQGQQVIDKYATDYDKEFGLSSLVDPDFYANRVAPMIPYMISAGALGGLGAGIAGSSASALGLGGTAAQMAPMIGAGVTGGTFESAMEAGSVYSDMLAKGYTEEEAQAAANKAMGANMVLNMALNGLEWKSAWGGFADDAFRGTRSQAMKEAAKRIGSSALEEAFQEGGQDIISRWSQDEDVKFDRQLLESMVLGGMMGGGMGSFGTITDAIAGQQTIQANINNAYADVRSEMPTQTQKHLDAVIDTMVQNGVPEQVAKANAVLQLDKYRRRVSPNSEINTTQQTETINIQPQQTTAQEQSTTAQPRQQVVEPTPNKMVFGKGTIDPATVQQHVDVQPAIDQVTDPDKSSSTNPNKMVFGKGYDPNAEVNTEAPVTPQAQTEQEIETQPQVELVKVDPRTLSVGDTVYDPTGREFTVTGFDKSSVKVRNVNGVETALGNSVVHIKQEMPSTTPQASAESTITETQPITPIEQEAPLESPVNELEGQAAESIHPIEQQSEVETPQNLINFGTKFINSFKEFKAAQEAGSVTADVKDKFINEGNMLKEYIKEQGGISRSRELPNLIQSLKQEGVTLKDFQSALQEHEQAPNVPVNEVQEVEAETTVSSTDETAPNTEVDEIEEVINEPVQQEVPTIERPQRPQITPEQQTTTDIPVTQEQSIEVNAKQDSLEQLIRLAMAEIDDGIDETNLAELGKRVIPGIAEEDAATTGRLYTLYHNGDLGAKDWNNYVSSMDEAGRIASPEAEKRSELNALREANKDFEQEALRFRKLVRELGGVNDPTYESIPAWAKRKHGKTLDLLVGEISEEGFPVQDANELFDLLNEYSLHNVRKISPQIPRQSKPNAETVKSNFIDRLQPQKPGTVDSRITNIPNEIKVETPSAKIARVIQDKLAQAQTIDSTTLYQAADEAYGGTQAEGKYNRKDAYDAMELGINKYLITNKDLSDTNVSLDKAQATLDKIRTQILDRIPTQNVRTVEQDQFQQFSTPPTLAFVAARTANISENDVVLEPSAGIGGLALFGKAAGAKVIVNELSPRRAEILKEMRFDRLFTENAEQIHNILPDDVKPSVVIMNPPFSSTAGRTKNNKTSNATAHIEQALKRLEPNGRLVAIVGRGMDLNAPAFKNWWDKIKGEYNVLANVGVNGKNYTKYGTSFDNRILVIDKTGATTQPIKTGYYDNLNDLMSALEGVRNGRIRIDTAQAQSSSYQPNSQEAFETSQTTNRPELPSSATTDTLGDGEGYTGIAGSQQSTSEGFQGNSGISDVSSGSGSSDELIISNRSDGVGTLDDSQASTLVQNTRGPSGISSQSTDGSTNKQSNVGTARLELEQQTDSNIRTKEDLGDKVFTTYRPSKVKIKGAKQHPGVLAESAAMSAIEPPEPSYVPSLPTKIVDEGRLSDAQLESVVYAGQAHQQELPSGETRGYFIGDGTGVGKGRQIAGIILDNMQQGKTKAVWVSKNEKLYPDAIRDATALGIIEDQLFYLGKIKPGQPINNPSGILFTTYTTLGQGLESSKSGQVRTKDSSKARLDQIVNWLGKDFDGVIVFDEAHEMQNSLSQKGQRGSTKPAIKALAGIELQKRLPKAKIVYVSATGASSVSNLAFAQRLGLWGKGTAFADVNDFINKVNQGGLAALEMVARDMKAMGVYLARSLSYEGVGYSTLEHKLNPDQRVVYDEMAKGWQVVLQNINEALEVTGAGKDGRTRGNAYSQFWSAHQRFFNQILTSMQMPSVVESIKQDLSDGKSVVLQLVNTNQAIQERRLAQREEGDALEELDLTPRDMLMQFLEKSFPVYQYEVYTDDNGNERSRLVVDSQGNPVINKEAEAKRDSLLDRIGSMKVPEGPLEIILNTFGTNNVAEITGRTRRVVKTRNRAGQETAKIENRSKRHVEADVDAFMDDRKRILVFSDAGGTGKSYHADLTRKNQRQRKHYLIQAGWRAENAVQGFGRTHRTNEASAPEYVLVTTDLKGQKRFISSIARRLDQLGALTKGQRETGSQGLFSARDNLESTIAMDALERFYKDLSNGNIEGLNAKELLHKMGLDGMLDQYGNLNETADKRDITKWLNRLLSLESDLQNQVFDAYSERLDDLIEIAMAEGTLDLGLENYQADSINIANESTVFVDENSGAETKYVELNVKNKVEPVSFERANQKFRWDRTGKRTELNQVDPNYKGMVYNSRSKRIYALFDAGTQTLSSGRITNRYRLLDQRGDVRYITQTELGRETWENIDEKNKAKQLWNEAVENLPEFKEEKIHLITGVLLPIWDRLPDGNMRVFRVVTDDGQMMLGRVIPDNQIDYTLRNLGTTRNKEQQSANQVIERIIDKGDTVYLANGWKLTRRLVSGEHRIEIEGDDLWKYSDELTEAGVFSERINYRTRFFIPVGSNASQVFDSVTEFRPVTDVISANGSPNVVGMPSNTTTLEQEVKNAQTAKNTHPIKRIHIVQKVRKLATIREKRMRLNPKHYKGEYDSKTGVIRLKNVEDIDTLAHEFGHDLQEMWGIDTSDYAELVDMGRSLYGEQANKMTKKQLSEEGFAQYMRYWLQAPQLLDTKAPSFKGEFDSLLNSDPELNEALAELQSMYQQWQEQSPVNKVSGQIVTESDVSKHREFLTKPQKEYQSWVDNIHGLFRFMEIMLGKKLSSEYDVELSKNPYVLARMARSSKALADVMLHSKGSNVEGQLQGKSLKGILDPVKNDIENFTTWLVAKRAHALHEQGKISGFDPTDVEITIHELENETFVNVQQDLEAFQENLLEFLVDAQMLTREQVDTWKELNPYYVPFYRFFDEDFRYTSKGGTKRFADLNKPIKKYKGSERSVIDPIESIVKNTYSFIQLAAQNRVGLAIAELANAPDTKGKGWLIHEVKAPVEATQVSLEQIRKELIAAGLPEDAMEMMDLEQMATVFRPMQFAGFKEKRENILTVYQNGKPRFYQVHPELYEIMNALDPNTSVVLAEFLRPFTALKRTLATFSPNFMARNPVRDAMSAQFFSKYKFVPIVDTLRGLSHVLKRDDIYYEWLINGGGMSTMVSLDRKYLRGELKNIIKDDTKKGVKDRAKDAWNWFLDATQALEEATRVQVYARGKEAEVESRGADTKEGRTWAAYASREATLDFQRYGNKGKAINQMKAFFNANIQGTDKAFRYIKHQIQTNPVGFLAKTFTRITLPSLLLFMMNKDDEEYWELPEWRRDGYWNIKTGDGKWITIPKPFELGIIFGTIPERFMEYVAKNDPAAFEELGTTLADTFLPASSVWDMVPDAILPILEVTANYDSWQNRNIEGMADRNKKPEERYSVWTSETAKAIGRTFGVSPKMVEHLLEGYGAGSVSFILNLVDLMTEEGSSKIDPASVIPGASAFTTDSYYSPESVDDFYNTLEEYEMNYPDHPYTKTLRSYSRQISDLRKQMNSILESPQYSREQKQQARERYNRLIVSAARRALGRKQIQ